MKCDFTSVMNCMVVSGERHPDDRGFFQEIYKETDWQDQKPVWRQTNWSKSDKFVLRGIHVAPYEKLVTCVTGRIFDVCVDLRPQSPTYLKSYCTILDENTPRQIYIPAHCGHAFLSLEWDTNVFYLQNGCYAPEREWTLRWNDPQLGIQWPVLETEVILSEKDRAAPLLQNFIAK